MTKRKKVQLVGDLSDNVVMITWLKQIFRQLQSTKRLEPAHLSIFHLNNTLSSNSKACIITVSNTFHGCLSQVSYELIKMACTCKHHCACIVTQIDPIFLETGAKPVLFHW